WPGRARHLPGQVRGAGRCAGRRPGARGVAGDARPGAAAVLAFASWQSGQRVLFRRMRWLHQAAALEGVLVWIPGPGGDRALHRVLRGAARHPGGTGMTTPIKLGIVGGRGHTGAELIRMVSAHPRFDLAFVSSRELDGQRVADHVDAWQGELRYSSPAHEDLPGLGADGVVLALPNGKAAI